jgi:hypothetical protein
MSATTPDLHSQRSDGVHEDHVTGVRRSTETKSSFKTTEFFAYLAVLAGIFIAGAATKGGHAHDVFRATQIWLYAAIVTVGYMISRGLAKTGSRDPYTDHR